MKMLFLRPWALGFCLLSLAPGTLPAQSQTIGREWPVYFSTQGNSSVYRMDSSGNQTLFTSAGWIQEASGLAFDARGNLFVSSVNNNSIVKVSPAGQQSLFAAGGLLAAPHGLAFDKSGNLYVACFTSNRIVRIDQSGKQTYFGTGSTTQLPQSLAFDSAGNLWVGTAAVSYLSRIDPTGTQEILTGVAGGYGMEFVNDTDLWTTDSTASAVLMKTRTDGTFLGFYQASGLTVTSPAGVGLDSTGGLWVIDRGVPNSNAMPHIGKAVLPCPDITCLGALFDLSPDYPTSAPPQAMAFTLPVSYISPGFTAPVVNAPAQNIGNAGRIYPLKWSLSYADGSPVSALSAVASVSYKGVPCSDLGTTGGTLLAAASTGSSGLRFDGSQFVYNWQTPSTPGCYQLSVTFDSNQTLTAFFSLK